VNSDAMNNSGQFRTTRWSVVLLAGQEGSSESTAALEKLCRAYWLPIFFFARRKGWEEEDAKDLTQQFFAQLLARNDFGGLDPRKGKFRTFLLAAFTHFLANAHDRATALKRGSGERTLSLDEFTPDELGDLPSTGAVSAGDLYDQRWAKTILQTALLRLEEEMSDGSKGAVFEALKHFLTVNAAAGDYATLGEQLNVEPSSVPVMVHRLRQRYREVVREEVSQTVTSPTELNEEMRHLFAVLNQ
jgi:RNA polymerase sigma-70 factor (ECF subfamily)